MMKTVRVLKEELSKFPDDAVCYAYEGEVTGIIIQRTPDDVFRQGVIHCHGRDGEPPDKETKLLPP